MNSFKKNIIKNRTYYFFDGMIIIKNIDLNQDRRKVIQNILIYYTG